jgi:Helicase conserved C-terminal domain
MGYLLRFCCYFTEDEGSDQTDDSIGLHPIKRQKALVAVTHDINDVVDTDEDNDEGDGDAAHSEDEDDDDKDEGCHYREDRAACVKVNDLDASTDDGDADGEDNGNDTASEGDRDGDLGYSAMDEDSKPDPTFVAKALNFDPLASMMPDSDSRSRSSASISDATVDHSVNSATSCSFLPTDTAFSATSSLKEASSKRHRDDHVKHASEPPESDKVHHDWWMSLRGAPMADTSGRGLLTIPQMVKLGSKVITFLGLLAHAVNQDDKVLLFSQSLETLDFLEKVLRLDNWGELVGVDSVRPRVRFGGWQLGSQLLRIDGHSKKRQALIDQFNNEPKVKLFLLSTKAANAGINLQSANRVIIFESSFNPADDLQAIHRCYRYGQDKSVFIYRLVMKGMMEEKIYRRQIDKQNLALRVIDAQMNDREFSSLEKDLMQFDTEDTEPVDAELAAKIAQLQSGTGTSDVVMSAFLDKHSDLFTSILDHDTFLGKRRMKRN